MMQNDNQLDTLADSPGLRDNLWPASSSHGDGIDHQTPPSVFCLARPRHELYTMRVSMPGAIDGVAGAGRSPKAFTRRTWI